MFTTDIALTPPAGGDMNEFNPSFVRGVRHIADILVSENECYEFLYEVSRIIDEEIEIILENYRKMVKNV